MNGKENQNPMWGELQEFVRQVEGEQKQPGEAKPYIERSRYPNKKYAGNKSGNRIMKAKGLSHSGRDLLLN